MRHFTIILALCAFSCGEIAWQRAKSDHARLEIPSYLEPTSQLNPAGSLQFQSTVREIYVVLIEDELPPVEISLRAYADLVTRDYQNLANYELLGEEEISANSMPALRRSWTVSTPDGEPDARMYCQFLAAAGAIRLFQVTACCPDEERTAYEPVLDRIVLSLTER